MHALHGRHPIRPDKGLPSRPPVVYTGGPRGGPLLELVAILYASLVLPIGLYGVAQAHLLWLAGRRSREALAPPLVGDDVPFVTVQLPLFNEPLVAEGLLACVAGLDWPHDRLQIQVLDDSTDETTAILAAGCARLVAQGLPIEHVRRPHRGGYKAGALADAMASVRGDLIAIFDADFRPRPDFLRRAVAQLGPDVGLVQARWGWLNRDQSLFTRLLSLHLDAHFAVEQPGRHRGGLFFGFNGTAGVWRRACIEDAGGWEADTLTEDLDLAFRARLAGWDLRYVEEIAAPSEVPADIAGIRTQQFRWMKGGAQVARKMLARVWRSEAPLVTRLQATAHLGGGGVFGSVLLLCLVGPLVAFVAADAPGWFPVAIGLASLPMQLTLLVLVGVYGSACVRRDGPLRGVLRFAWLFPLFLAFSVGLSLHNAVAVVDGWSGRASPFVRTPKAGSGGTGAGAALASALRPVAPLVWVELGVGAWLLAAALSQLAAASLLTAWIFGMQAAGFLGLAVASVLRAWPAKAIAHRVVAVAASTSLALLVAEGGLRLVGQTPWTEPPVRFDVEPAGWIQPDDVYGFALAPGRFTVAYGEEARAVATHAADGRRATPRGAGPTVEVHGGSFTYDLGVSDEATLPWQLAERLPGWRVRNRGVAGYGPVQAWIALEEHVAAGTTPDAMVVAYAAFQDERVTLVRNWRRSLRPWSRRDGLAAPALPSVRARRGTPRVVRRSAAFEPWGLSGRSALVSRVDLATDVLHDLAIHSHGVSRNLLLQLHRRGEEAGVRVLLVGLEDDRYTRDTLRWCARRGGDVLDLGLPWQEPAWSLAPHDPTHPNPAAHARWADGIAAELGPPQGPQARRRASRSRPDRQAASSPASGASAHSASR